MKKLLPKTVMFDEIVAMLEWLCSFRDPNCKKHIIDDEPLKQAQSLLARAKK